jgi:putative oxidoreductase
MKGSIMQNDLGKLLLRLTTGGLLLCYGVYKLQNGIGVVKQMVTSHGLPELVTNGVYLGEVVAPFLVIVGLFTRLSASVMAINMLAAIYLAGTANLLKTGAYGAYALEIEAFFLLNAIAIALLGPGKFALGGSKFG